MTTIMDTNVVTTPYLNQIVASGTKKIIRYLDPIGPNNPKVVKEAEARAIAASGLRLGLVSEGFGDFAHGGISAGAGERDGTFALKTAPSLGAPDGACIYFTVDTDASAVQIQKLVLPYFQAVRKAIGGKFRVGVYGSGNVCEAVLNAKLADLAWLSCSMGWSGSEAFLKSNKWALRQYVPTSVAGVPCDPDDANGDFGDFVPFAEASTTKPTKNITENITAAAEVSPAEQFMNELHELVARYRL